MKVQRKKRLFLRKSVEEDRQDLIIPKQEREEKREERVGVGE